MTDDDTMANVRGGAAAGTALGGMLGALLGWMVAATPDPIPVIGPVVGQGVLSTALVGLLAGAGTGALVGALFGAFSSGGRRQERTTAEVDVPPAVVPLATVTDAEPQTEAAVVAAEPDAPVAVLDAGDTEAGALVEPSASELEVGEPPPVPDLGSVSAGIASDVDLEAAPNGAAGEPAVDTPTEPAVAAGSRRVRRARRVAPRYMPPASDE